MFLLFIYLCEFYFNNYLPFIYVFDRFNLQWEDLWLSLALVVSCLYVCEWGWGGKGEFNVL